MKIKKLNWIAFILLAFSALAFVACEKTPAESAIEPIIQLRTSDVGSEAGSAFVAVQADGAWQLALRFGDAEPWASLSVDSGNGNKSNVILTYEKNVSDQARTLEIYLSASSHSYTAVLTQKGGNNGGNEGGDKPVVPSGKFVINASWLELPDMSDKSLDYISHHFENNGKKYRNYSIGYSEKDVVSLWVAYPLCRSYIGSVRRPKDAWAYDPILGPQLSPAPFGGYAEEFDRGHLLPSGSRTCCKAANDQTFYGSNMAPQVGKGFNQDIWAVLEGKVRSYAGSVDTLYVVTGCILEGSTRKTPDSDRKQITVPTGFYKAVLSYHKSSTYSKWLAAAFYLDHKYYSTQAITKDMSMSIDDLEKKTGIDFFPNLIDKIGKEEADKVEKQNPQNVAFWW